MATLNEAFKSEAQRLGSLEDDTGGDSKNQLLIAMCGLLIQLLQQIKDKDENPSSSDLYAKPKKIITGLIPYPS